MLPLRREIADASSGRDSPRLTLVRAGGLGDTLLVMPALQAILQAVPESRLTLVGSAWAERLQPLMAIRFRLLRFDSASLTPLFSPSCAADPTDAFAGADAVVVYTSDPEDSLTANARRFCRGPVVAWPVRPAPGEHAVLHFARAVVGPEAALSDLPLPSLAVAPALQEWGRRWASARLGTDARPVAIHPGSGSAAKCWPVERFARLMEMLDAPAVVFEGPADVEVCRRLEHILSGRRGIAWARQLALEEAAGLLSACRLYVGNDSGLTHLAAALGVPTVTVFGPTDPQVWRPLGRRVAIALGRLSVDPWPSVEEVLAAYAALAYA
jgi:ADP-heptose:LPS heptosyltransferase